MLARIEAFAAEQKINRHLALIWLIERGLNAPVAEQVAIKIRRPARMEEAITEEPLTFAHVFGGTPASAARLAEAPPPGPGGVTASLQFKQDANGCPMLLVTEPYTPRGRETVTIEPLRMPRAPVGSRAKKPGKPK